ncbi:MAG: hypothetical protein KBA31_10640 [Alphaproteobacteria bacterium]|nr:hypothetical protein [Alphaproteobacteria bacterium]
MHLARIVIAFASLIAASFTACADSWLPPQVKTYLSANKRVRFTVTPRDLEGPLPYFEGKQRGDDKPGQLPGSNATAPRGLLEHALGNGGWQTVWARDLVNDVAPVSALVSNTGAYVVTFDNWHSKGFGKDAVVIYGPQAKLVRAFALNDILPDYYVDALPRSVSSLQWNGKHTIDQPVGMLKLKIIVPTQSSAEAESYIEVGIELATGVVRPPKDGSWERALAQAARARKAQQAAEAADDARFRAPLIGPTSVDEGDWHQYLVEAFFRLDPCWDDHYPAVKILRDPRAADYAPSEVWLREEFADPNAAEERVIVIASPASPDNLVKVLTAIIGTQKPNALKGSRFYAAVPASHRARVAAAIAPTAAIFVHIEPTVPIPQRPERLVRRFGK